MNRTIKFRGKRLDNGEWVYGYYAAVAGTHKIVSYKLDSPSGATYYEVAPETVGQFTGLLDRNGKEVYEGDVVFWIATDTRGRGRGEQGAIFWDKHTMSWAIERDKPCVDGRPCIISRPFDKKHLEVVGNIHDNPELMEQCLAFNCMMK